MEGGGDESFVSLVGETRFWFRQTPVPKFEDRAARKDASRNHTSLPHRPAAWDHAAPLVDINGA